MPDPLSEGGTARPITMHGDPVLHRPCAEVTVFDDELVTLVKDMYASMYAARGVGLAANQVGVGLRVFVVDCPNDDEERVVAHVVNPELELPAERTLEEDAEGCLSVPGPSSELARPDHATVRGIDVHGNPVVIEGTGLLARCLQHETDHLNGMVYVDRISAKERKRVLAEAFPG
ncbi:MAG: peptide deformylase [Mycobacteriales bacterium]